MASFSLCHRLSSSSSAVLPWPAGAAAPYCSPACWILRTSSGLVLPAPDAFGWVVVGLEEVLTVSWAVGTAVVGGVVVEGFRAAVGEVREEAFFKLPSALYLDVSDGYITVLPVLLSLS